MSTKIQKIDYAIYHNPNLIPILIKDCSINNGLIYSRLRRAVSRRVGIEFECIGNPAEYYNNSVRELSHPKDLKSIFNLLDYDQDDPINRRGAYSNPLYNRYRDLSNTLDDAHFNELRVSMKDYSQLQGLYKILDLFKNSCIIPIGGGIHIHIDFKDYDFHNIQLLASKYVKNHLREVESIFPKYLGSFNSRKVGIAEKRTYVNFSYHGSIEFRIAPLTFDYETLIKWVVNCNKFVTKLIHECHLIPGKDMDTLTGSNPNEDYCNSFYYRDLISDINDIQSGLNYYMYETESGSHYIRKFAS